MQTFIPTLSKLTHTCRRVLLWLHSIQTCLSTQTLIRSSGRFLFTVIARTSLLVPADISFYLSRPIQTKPSIQMFSYQRHGPHKITCPYKQAFTFLCRSLHRSTRPQRHLLFTDISHTGLLAHTDVFQLRVRPTQAYLSIWTFYFHLHSLHMLSHPRRRFLASAATYTGQFVHTEIFFSLTWSTQAFSSTCTFSSFSRGPHRPTRPHGHFLLSVTAYIGLLDYTDVVFLLSQPTLTYSSKQIISSFQAINERFNCRCMIA